MTFSILYILVKPLKIVVICRGLQFTEANILDTKSPCCQGSSKEELDHMEKLA